VERRGKCQNPTMGVVQNVKSEWGRRRVSKTLLKP